MTQGPPSRVSQADLSLHIQLLHANFPQQIRFDFLLHAHARKECHALVILHQPANGLHRWHLYIHIQRHFLPLKLAQDRFAIWRNDVMRDEGFHIELANRNIRAVSKTMPRGYHEREPVDIEHLCHQMLVGGIITEDAQFKLSVQQLRRDLAGFGAPYLYLYFWEKAAILLYM